MPRAIRPLLLLAAVALVASCSKSTVTSPEPTATLTNGAVQLVWNPVPDKNLGGYRVYYGTASRTYVQSFGQGLQSSEPTYTVNGLAGGHRYFFAVTATNSVGMESGYSDEVAVDIP